MNEAQLNSDHEAVESKFFPLYDKILCYWFPEDDGYDVHPQWEPGYVITFIVKHLGWPLLLLEFKASADFHLESRRENAISHIMQHLDEIGPANQNVPRLYAISAIGKRWRASYVTKGNGSSGGQPVKGVAEMNSLRSSVARCWNPDITSDTSYDAFRKIVDTIKSYVA